MCPTAQSARNPLPLGDEATRPQASPRWGVPPSPAPGVLTSLPALKHSPSTWLNPKSVFRHFHTSPVQTDASHLMPTRGGGGDGVPPGFLFLEDVMHPALPHCPSLHQTLGAACDSQSDHLLSPRNSCVCTAPPTWSSLPSRSQHLTCSRPAHSPLPSALPTNIYPTLTPQSSTRLTNIASLGPPSYEESPGSPA